MCRVFQKSDIVILLGVFMLTSCGERPADAQEDAERKAAEEAHMAALRAWVAQVPDLVVAKHAPRFHSDGHAIAEAVWAEGVWKIHHSGKWRADCRSGEEIGQAMRQMREEYPESRVLISAAADTAYGEISNLIRGAASAGFGRIDFLVSTGTPGLAMDAFHLELPHMKPDDAPNKIEPFAITIDADGSVFTGLVDSRTLHDTDPADHALSKLNASMRLFISAANATDTRPVCMVHVDRDARYQRMIDLMATFQNHGITDLLFTDLTMTAFE